MVTCRRLLRRIRNVSDFLNFNIFVILITSQFGVKATPANNENTKSRQKILVVIVNISFKTLPNCIMI